MTSSPYRLLAAFLVPMFAIAVAACGSGAQPAQPTTPAAPTEPAAAAAAPAPAPPPAAGGPAAAAKPTAPGPSVTPDGVVFNFKPDGGKKKVFLAGNFNDWNPSDPKYLMTDAGNGAWTITIKLLPGAYQYKYVADGQWIKDPYSPSDAPDGFGGRNGKFEVK
jgi:hypothetical protein